MGSMNSIHGGVRVVIRTIGTLHPDAVSHIEHGALFFDLGNRLRNPHDDPRMRYRTGLDPEVRDHVLTAPGANTEISAIVDSTAALLRGYADSRHQLVHVAVACRGGRHRSVAIAEIAAEYLRAEEDIGVEVEHVHIDRPVIEIQK